AKTPPPPPTIPPPAPLEEIGQVTYVRAAAVVVRGSGPEATRRPLEKGMILCTGDRIQCEASPAGATDPSARTGLELWGGAEVDLAGGTTFELTGYDTYRLVQGRLYADVALDRRKNEAPAARERKERRLLFGTPAAELTIL